MRGNHAPSTFSIRYTGIALAALAAAATFAVSSSAFTADADRPASRVGSGSAATRGYAVSEVRYTLAAGHASRVATVDFALDAPADRVLVQLDAGGLAYPCATAGVVGSLAASETHPVCALDAPAASIRALRVAATKTS